MPTYHMPMSLVIKLCIKIRITALEASLAKGVSAIIYSMPTYIEVILNLRRLRSYLKRSDRYCLVYYTILKFPNLLRLHSNYE